MAYNEQLAHRIRTRLKDLPNIEEKKMMGGLAFMYNDKMCVGIMKNELMCRIDKSFHEEAVELPGCRTMDFTGKPMIGYVLIEDTAIVADKDFDYWIRLSLDYNKHAKSSKRK